MRKLVKTAPFRYAAYGAFCLAFSVAAAASAGFFYAVKNNLYAKDAVIETAFDKFASSMKYGFGIIAVSTVAASALFLAFLLAGAGYKKGFSAALPRMVEKLPFEVYLALLGFSVYGGVKLCLLVLQRFGFWNLFIICPTLLLCSFFCAEAFVSAAVRYKTGILGKSTLLFRAGAVFYDAYAHFSLIWKVSLACVFYFGATFFTFHAGVKPRLPLWVWIALTVIFTALAGSLAVFTEKLGKGAQKIARGDLNHKVNTELMYSEFKVLGENLNNIGAGLLAAVEEKVKSERFRTELITNVSHDIKTPLTSIINYVDLLKDENLTPERKKEYIAVLERQTSRLKKLITDLVEASKAYTKNIAVNLAPTKLQELVSQAEAEYVEKLAALNLSVVNHAPETPVTVYADGRLTWRIFDNLFSNICRYSLPGTRVYVEIIEGETASSVIFKNISETPPRVPSAELTERFVRGDYARSTEGSGLGLSIASSLAEIQGGNLKIELDGDLFKAEVTFQKHP